MSKKFEIFEVHANGLYSVKFLDCPKNEMSRVFSEWQDLDYLYNFFKLNMKDLFSGYYQNVTFKTAISKTMQDAKTLERQLMSTTNGSLQLDDIFKPLDNQEFRSVVLQKSKAYHTLEQTWIRVYALKLESNVFVITGGTIKLTRGMFNRTHTLMELRKLNNIRDALRLEGVIDAFGLK
jgi:hypothetical protein